MFLLQRNWTRSEQNNLILVSNKIGFLIKVIVILDTVSEDDEMYKGRCLFSYVPSEY